MCLACNYIFPHSLFCHHHFLFCFQIYQYEVVVYAYVRELIHICVSLSTYFGLKLIKVVTWNFYVLQVEIFLMSSLSKRKTHNNYLLFNYGRNFITSLIVTQTWSHWLCLYLYDYFLFFQIFYYKLEVLCSMSKMLPLTPILVAAAAVIRLVAPWERGLSWPILLELDLTFRSIEM